jgi:Domain of unknown function (DUF4345)
MPTSSLFNFTGAILTTGLGIIGLFNPMLIARTIGIERSEPRGISELRATYGGLFIGLGMSAIYFQNTAIYTTIGCGWIGAAIARICSILIDRQISKLNIGGVVVKAGIGMLLLIKV